MDYPQLNLLFGMTLIFTVMVNVSLRILLTKMRLSAWLSTLSWAALLLSILSASYIEILLLRRMSAAFNWQIVLGVLIMGGIGAVVTASLYRKEIPSRLAGFLFSAQMLTSLVSIFLAFGLYRTLVPMFVM